MDAQDVALIASYVCPWGTLLAIAAVIAWTAQRLAHNGLSVHLPGVGPAQGAAPMAAALPMPAPLFRSPPAPYVRPAPAQARVTPSFDDPYPLPSDPLDEPTGDLQPVS